jgi:hypothetical protein
LLSLLDSHPELVVFPEEDHFFKNVYFAKNKHFAINRTGFRCLYSDEYLKDWSKGKSWFQEGYKDFDKESFKILVTKNLDEFESSKLLFLKLIDDFAQVAKFSVENKKKWVTKTTQNEIYYPIMRKLFNDRLFFLYLVRDPRDVATSLLKRNEVLIGDSKVAEIDFLKQFCAEWKVQVSQALKYSKKHENFKILKFEDLVKFPQVQLEKISNWINISYREELLTPTRLGQKWQGNSVFENNKSCVIYQDASDRYIEKLRPSYISLIESMLQKELDQFGYGYDRKSLYLAKDTKYLMLKENIKYHAKSIIIQFKNYKELFYKKNKKN